ncbi:hypothetical protein SPBR_08095 [Sporothrix brasiliensis 5110]|uniref:Fe2OG dioxygenase domain-containing protein n=1 Tax=Sporothrix brasiliensis 5110 TaxID=1398154 RepID=A0A0C2EJZ5_9PEZI|nr:uncharacterized protein SPBR_08095 [Sporothrix brasiliensis 5110]KIH86389.1 hypothetical protein SPBR_08095 [Sporothrix brasiliensis 5110]
MDPAVNLERPSGGTDIANVLPSPGRMTLARAKTGVRAALDLIQSPGDFAVWKVLKDTPADLGLHMLVNGVGSIDFPLREASAKQIIAQAKQAPYGRGEETVVDTSVRNTWELDASQFKLLQESGTSARQDMGWHHVIDTARKLVIETMGLNCRLTSLRAEPYKMLLYEKGAHFKAHTDSPKIPGMFATLVIVLPSEHEGGDLILKHRHTKKTFKSSHATNKTGIGFMSWYTDVQHEVEPVTSGYRWVLTYNLALESGAPSIPQHVPTASALVDPYPSVVYPALVNWLAEATDDPTQVAALEIEANKAEAMAEAVRGQWNWDSHRLLEAARETRRRAEAAKCAVPHAVYGLDHHYTETNLLLSAARGRDAGVLKGLQSAVAELPVDIFLAILEKQEEGSCDDDEDGYHSRNQYYGYSNYEEDENRQNAEWHAIQEVYSTTYSIKKLLALDGSKLAESMDLQKDNILQDDCFVDADGKETDYQEGYSGNERFSMFESAPANSNLDHLLKYLKKTCTSPVIGRDKDCLEILRAICDHLWTPEQPLDYDTRPVDEGHAATVLSIFVTMRDWEYFEKVLKESHGDFDAKSFFDWVNHMINNDQNVTFAQIETHMRSAVLALPALSDAFNAISTICPKSTGSQAAKSVASSSGASDRASREEWAQTTTEILLDGLGSKALGYVDAFALGYLSVIADKALTTQSPDLNKQWTAIYEILAEPVVAEMDISALSTSAGFQQKLDSNLASRLSWDNESKWSEFVKVLDSEHVSCFYRHIFSINTPVTRRLRLELSRKIASFFTPDASGEFSGAKPNKLEELKFLWLPVLRQISGTIKDHAIEDNDDTSNAAAGAASLLPPHQHCTSVNTFLADGNMKTYRVKVNKTRRQHIQQSLEINGVDCTHESERHTTPHTLVLTKTTKHFTKERADWTRRKATANHTLQDFSQTDLRRILGTSYDEIMSMEKLTKRVLASARKPDAKRVRTEDAAAAPGTGSGVAPLPPQLAFLSTLPSFPFAPGTSIMTVPPTPSPGRRIDADPSMTSPLPARGTKRRAVSDVVDLTEVSE